ncbi:MAG TPA: glycosyltransferase [Longimicrobiales bacterium]|nr:glycosyltransferase [Longimicrobiales bacterium]
MNLVHIVDNLAVGGAQAMLRVVVAGLAARGYRQHVICLNEVFSPPVVQSLRDAGASVEVIGRPLLFSTVGFWRIVAALRRRRPAIVHTMMPWGDLVGRTAARLAGARPVVSTVTARYATKPRIQLLLDRATAGWADRFVFESSEIVPFSIAHEGVRPDQVRCIPNGVKWDDRDRGEAAARLREEFGGGARMIIGMVARLHSQKAHADVIEALVRLGRESEDLRVWFVGDGPERARLAALAERRGVQDCIVFAGERHDARDWIAAMDLFVHPTYFEGLPVAVLEAMAESRPVVASDVDGLREVIVPGVHGWLVPPGDVEALADAIRTALGDRERTARVARAGAERVRSEFTATRVIESYDALFRSLVPGAGPTAPANVRR